MFVRGTIVLIGSTIKLLPIAQCKGGGRRLILFEFSEFLLQQWNICLVGDVGFNRSRFTNGYFHSCFLLPPASLSSLPLQNPSKICQAASFSEGLSLLEILLSELLPRETATQNTQSELINSDSIRRQRCGCSYERQGKPFVKLL